MEQRKDLYGRFETLLAEADDHFPDDPADAEAVSLWLSTKAFPATLTAWGICREAVCPKGCFPCFHLERYKPYPVFPRRLSVPRATATEHRHVLMAVLYLWMEPSSEWDQGTSEKLGELKRDLLAEVKGNPSTVAEVVRGALLWLETELPIFRSALSKVRVRHAIGNVRAMQTAAKLAAKEVLASVKSRLDLGDGDDLVTLDQAAALSHVSKRTLERYLAKHQLPRPDYPGGSGKAHKWLWSSLRPALEKHCNVILATRFPGSRIIP